jgi:hypothetical protein
VIDVVKSRLTDGEQSVDAVVSVDERRAIVHGYSQLAGYPPDSLKQMVSLTSQEDAQRLLAASVLDQPA